jgi:acyl-CoA reductase-like NAD-dependent aldehyde dehydrogenase
MTAANAISRARKAQHDLRDLSVARRLQAMRQLRSEITARIDPIVDLVVEETGKPPVEALGGEILATLEIIRYHEKHAARILRPEKRPTPWFLGGGRSRVEYPPHGVAAIFSPWNYPFHLALAPLVTALAAGNAVILKPSEVTPRTTELILELMGICGLPADSVQALQGGPEAGEALIEAQPDFIFFTGSTATGRKVMASAAKHLIPVELELGGKDPMIVFDDAPLDRAIEAAVHGAFAASGQWCVSIERLYVQQGTADEFTQHLVERTKQLRIGTSQDSDVGRITTQAQLDIIKSHYDDAIAKGATALTPWESDGLFLKPIILTDVTPDMRVLTEETFGPILPLIPFAHEEDAIRLANESPYGLNASVWTLDRTRAHRVASTLDTGNCAINDCCKNIANPHLPFGGVKQSGFGRYHGPEGLRAFTRPKSILIKYTRTPRDRNWFPYTGKTYTALSRILCFLHGR